MSRHLVIIAHPDDELVFMSPAMQEVLRGPAAVRIVYLTAGDAGRDANYWGAREAAILRCHAAVRPRVMAVFGQAQRLGEWAPGPEAAEENAPVGGGPLMLHFLRLADGMLRGEGSEGGRGESLRKLWLGDIEKMHALAEGESYTKEQLTAWLCQAIDDFRPTLLHTLNAFADPDSEHADHHATGLFAAAAAQRADRAVNMRFYVGSDSPLRPENVTGEALEAKIAAFAAYARHDAEIFNGRADWLTASIYAPMLRRQYYTECMSHALPSEAF